MTQLQQGISMLHDMEKNNYMMGRAIQQIDLEIASLGRSRKITMPQKKRATRENFYKNHDFTMWYGLGIILGVLGALIVGIIVYNGNRSNGIFNFFGASFKGIGSGLLAGVLIGAVACGIIAYFLSRKASTYCIEKQKEYDQDYNRALQNHKEKVALDTKRVSDELRIKQALQEERDTLLCRKAKSEKVLSIMYDRIGMNPNYRNLIAIAYMEEYIALGIAVRLEGIDGLYYLVKQELQKRMVWEKILEFGQKLDRIIELEQEQVYALDQLNSTCDQLLNHTKETMEQNAKMSDALKDIRANTKLSAYHLERIEKEEQYQSFFMTWVY